VRYWLACCLPGDALSFAEAPVVAVGDGDLIVLRHRRAECPGEGFADRGGRFVALPFGPRDVTGPGYQ
jgi:hypothetical protein